MPIFKREQNKMRKANAIFIHDVECRDMDDLVEKCDDARVGCFER